MRHSGKALAKTVEETKCSSNAANDYLQAFVKIPERTD